MTEAVDLAPIIQADGPFLSVELQTPAAIENAAQRSELGWKTLRNDLAAEGVPEELLGHVDPLVPDAHLHGDALFVVANHEGVLYEAHGAGGGAGDWGRWEIVPSLTRALEWSQQEVPYVVVRADRTGADIEAHVPGGDEVDETVKGGTHHIRKVHAGGWSSRRYEERAENLWEQNAQKVALRVNELVAEIRARVVVVAGDVRALAYFQEHLAPEVRDIVHEVDGGRGVDGSDEKLTTTIRRMVQTVVAQETVALLRKFREERGQLDRFADGPRAVAEALQFGRVETLLVHDDRQDERVAFFGPAPEHVALDPEALKALGAEPVQQARLADVLVRAAIGTGAGVRVVPHTSSSGPSGDVGAILRWT